MELWVSTSRTGFWAFFLHGSYRFMVAITNQSMGDIGYTDIPYKYPLFITHRIQGTGIFPYILVDLYGFHVGKIYNRPMDAMGYMGLIMFRGTHLKGFPTIFPMQQKINQSHPLLSPKVVERWWLPAQQTPKKSEAKHVSGHLARGWNILIWDFHVGWNHDFMGWIWWMFSGP